MMRYSTAKVKGIEAYRQVLKEDADLLKQFGLHLMGVEGGVTAAVIEEMDGDRIDPWAVIEINMKAWRWLYPLLVRLVKAERELRELKKEKQQQLAAK